MNPITVLRQMMVLFFMIAGGFCANKAGILDQKAEGACSKLIVNLTNPALIIASVATSRRLEDDSRILAVFGAAVCYYLVLPLLSKPLTRLGRPEKAVRSQFETILVFANIGFMGIPVASAVLGKESVLFVSIFVAIFNVAFYTYGVVTLSEAGRGSAASALRKIVNPGTVAAVFAVTMYLRKWQLPELLLSPIVSLGNVTTPMAMLIIGSSLARNPMGRMLREKTLYVYSAIRLLLLPLLMMAVGKYLISDLLLYRVMVLITAMPAASIVAMTRNDLGKDADFSARATAFSTFFCVLTIPVVAGVLGFISV